MQTDEHFRNLVVQHNEYKRLVEALEAKPVLTAEEELEEHRLKKLKLHLKDQMESGSARCLKRSRLDTLTYRWVNTSCEKRTPGFDWSRASRV